MSTPCHSPGRTVEPGPRWRTHKLLYVVMFAVTAAGVYSWGAAAAKRSGPDETFVSTATVYQQALPGSSKTAQAEGEDFQQRIAAEANLRRVVRRLDDQVQPLRCRKSGGADREVQQIARDLRVKCAETSLSGELGISISYADSNPKYTAALVNALAESHADRFRTEWKERSRRAYDEAREALDRAQRESLRAEARRDAFIQQRLEHPEPAAEETTDAIRPKPGHGPGTAEPTLVDNPAWIELAQRLAEARQWQTELLVDRTMEHPEVRQAGIEIGQLQEQLAATPREIPGQPDGPREPAEIALAAETPATVQAPQPRAETAEQLRELKVAAEQAVGAYEAAAGAERRARQQHQQEPQIELVLSQPLDVPAPAGPGLGMLLAALAAGVAMAAGTGMISAGAAMDPTIDTVVQARAASPVPVVGVVPAADSDSPSTDAFRLPKLIRPGVILTGWVLIVGCAAVLIGAFGGF